MCIRDRLGSVKDSIINAYEIKTGLSRAKLSHLMDAETWMDAGKAVELGFADGVLSRAEIPEDIEPPAVSMLYSKAAVVNSLMDKIAAKCRTNPKKTENPNPTGRSVAVSYTHLIWNYDKPKRNKNHPTSKPLDLLGYPICNSSQENAIVLDTFGGSGSTLMACEQLNRICHMMELDEKYASVILRRYVEDTGDKENVYVIRGDEQIPYSALVKEVEV